MSLRRWLAHGAIAAAAHVVAFVALSRAPRGPASTAHDEGGRELEVDLSTPPEEPFPPSPSPSPPSLDDTPRVHAPATGARLATRETSPGPRGTPEPSAQPSATAPPTSDGWTFDPRPPVDILAPAAVARALREGNPGGEVAAGPPTGVSKTGGLVEGLDAHDASLGLGRGGPVLSALEVAAASNEAPEGTATFDVAIDASGSISVSLLSASAAFGAWEKVGATAGASLDPRRVRIPPGANGWHVVAMVEAKVQYPNGVDPKRLGTKVEGSASPALKENKHRTSIEDPPIVFDKTPGVTVAHAGRVCSVAISLRLSFSSGIAGGCDPSNIGTNALRVVRSHVVSEGRL